MPTRPDLRADEARVSWALLILRLGVAAVFLPYGLVKLFTFPARVEFFASTGLPAPEVVTALNVSLEIGIGVLLLLGVQMPLAAALVIINTLGILTPVNWQAGPLDWWPQVAIRIAPALALALLGPGEFRLRSRDKLEGQLERV